ncbi:chloride intracellular channel protein 1, partial [Plakobranchus ocellatus]
MSNMTTTQSNNALISRPTGAAVAAPLFGGYQFDHAWSTVRWPPATLEHGPPCGGHQQHSLKDISLTTLNPPRVATSITLWMISVGPYLVHREVATSTTLWRISVGPYFVHSANFVRSSWKRLSKRRPAQAAVVVASSNFTEICWGMTGYKPLKTMEEDIQRSFDEEIYSVNCNQANNIDDLAALLLDSKNGSDSEFVFAIDLDLTLSFFTSSSSREFQVYAFYTKMNTDDEEVPAKAMETFHKNRENISIGNSMSFKDARALNRSVPDVIIDICKDYPNVSIVSVESPEAYLFVLLRINKTVGPMTWAQAKDACARRGMSLLQPRTPVEADLSLQKIRQQFDRQSFSQGMSKVNFFIGLRKGKSSIGHRFEWTDGPKTLFYSLWAKKQPGGSEECAFWVLKQNENGTLESQGWRSVGCGNAERTVSICQKRRYAIPEVMKVPADDTPVNDTLLYAKGNFIKVVINGNKTFIVSLSQAVSSGQLQQLLRSKKDIQIGGLLSEDLVKINAKLKRAIMAALSNLYHACWEDGRAMRAAAYRYGVSLAELCDGRRQCSSRSDEAPCGFHGYANCTSEYFQCRSRECVPLKYKCDLIADCDDKSDEENCEDSECKHQQCADGTCLPRSWFGDGQQDCEDFTGTNGFEHHTCMFICNRTECVTEEQLHNGVQDCHGPEGPLDVHLANVELVNCGAKRKSPKCVMIRDDLGEVIGCRDLRHLTHCENFTCPAGYVKCPRSYCIPQAYMADGRHDCILGEDEHKIEKPDPSRNFVCNDQSNQSVSLQALCDGRLDCAGGEDELDCGYVRMPGFLSLAGAIAEFDCHNHEFCKAPFQGLQYIDERTRHLDLSDVSVPDFFLTYPEGKLTHLLFLDLTNCGIVDIFRHARDMNRSDWFCEQHFRIRDLKALKSINLSKNNITTLPDCSVLKLMKGLELLSLSHNAHLSNLSRVSFSGLDNLSHLDLSFTGITHLPSDLFEDLISLRDLSLLGLRLQTLDAVFPNRIRKLNLELITVDTVDSVIFQNITKMEELRASSYVFCCPHVLGDLNRSRIPAHTCHAPDDPISDCS